MRRLVGVLLAVTLIVSCSATGGPGSHGADVGTHADAECGRGDTRTQSSLDSGVVVTPDPYASEIACRILAAGGSAADAVVAAQFTLGLTEPQSSGPGGGAVVVYYDAVADVVETWDASVPAGEDGTDGASLTGVPQTPRVMTSLHSRHGRLALDDLLAPAAELAEDGFDVSRRLGQAISRRSGVIEAPWPEPLDSPRFTNPRYAQYLRGVEADDTLEPGEPLCVGYRGHEVCGSGSTGTGMMVVAETLGILDRIPLDDDGDGETGDPAHVVTEAERLALANAHTWMQDPAVDPELSREYVTSLVTDTGHHARQAARIDPSATLGDIEPDPLTAGPGRYGSTREKGTSQITVRDRDGSTASVTSTLHQHFGTGETVDGYFLNNSLENFSPASKMVNVRRPGARPKTAMSPVIVLRDGAPVIAVGSPGGGHIPSFVIKTLVGIIDLGLSAADAVEADNYGATGRRSTYVEGDGSGTNSALSVIRVDGGVQGAADRRADGAARTTGP